MDLGGATRVALQLMSKNPINLALRFFLELAGLAAYAIWGWTQHTGVMRFVWAIGLVLLTASAWGIFRVDDYPGKAPVRVPGVVRLLLEILYFGAAVWLLIAAGFRTLGIIFGVITLLHYVASYDQVRWLLTER